MALDDKDKQEIRALVAEEIHNVLRREMAQWWAESLMALAGYPPADSPRRRGVTPRKVGRPAGGNGSGGDGGDPEYLVQVVESLLRSQEMLAQQLKDSLHKVEQWVQRHRSS